MTMTHPIGSSLPVPARWALIALVAAGAPAGVLIVWLTWWNAWSWVGTFLLSFCPMLAIQLHMRFFRNADIRPAGWRYGRRMAVNMLVYFAAFMGSVILYREGMTDGPWGYVVAVVPALPLVNCFVLVARLMRESDEVQRAIMAESMLWSGALTFGEATLWGFLETFGKVPHVWMWVVPVAFFAQLGLVAPLVVRKYR